jgi:hypothetical protein
MVMANTVNIGSINDQLRELSNIETRLNQQLAGRDFRKRLFDDPVEILRQEGVVLPREREQAVTDLFKSAKVPEDADLRLSTDRSALGISISIGIRF